jgi:Carboxypeptidase regulatory-like domain
MNRAGLLGCVALGLLLSCGAGLEAAQIPPPPPPPPPAPPGAPRDRVPVRTGTGVIKGRVVDGITGAPLARVRVRISTPVPRASAYTDATGSFAFTALPVGNYVINADKSTYLSGRFPEIGRTVRSFSMPRVLAEGQVVSDVVVRMYHGGAIAGRVVDAQGDPVESVNIRVLRLPPGGRGKPQMRNSTSTNDLGEFRVARLEPGSYLLSAVPQRNAPDEPVADAPAPPPQPVSTYYPNTVAIDQAQPIVIDRGQTVGGVEIMLAEGTLSTVSGTVLGADGQPLSNGGSINVRSASRDVAGMVDSIGGMGLRQDGTFRLQLPPGDYVLEAQASPPPASPGTPMRMENMSFGRAPVTVAGGNIEGLTIVVGRGAVVTGRIVFDGTTVLPPNNGDLHVMMFQGDGVNCRAGQPQIAADWTFRLEGMSGTCAATAQPLGGRWNLKSFTSTDEDLLKNPHTFEPGQTLANVQLVYTDRRTEISVRVADDNGQTTQEYVALIFPAVDKAAWTSAVQQVRILAPRPPEITAMLMSIQPPSSSTARNPSMMPMPAQEKVTGLRPGEYYAIAVDDMENELSRDPFVLERLAATATRITVGDGATIDLPLKRIRFADAMRER